MDNTEKNPETDDMGHFRRAVHQSIGRLQVIEFEVTNYRVTHLEIALIYF